MKDEITGEIRVNNKELFYIPCYCGKNILVEVKIEREKLSPRIYSVYVSKKEIK
jgi:hypothetical protein